MWRERPELSSSSSSRIIRASIHSRGKDDLAVGVALWHDAYRIPYVIDASGQPILLRFRVTTLSLLANTLCHRHSCLRAAVFTLPCAPRGATVAAPFNSLRADIFMAHLYLPLRVTFCFAKECFFGTVCVNFVGWNSLFYFIWIMLSLYSVGEYMDVWEIVEYCVQISCGRICFFSLC